MHNFEFKVRVSCNTYNHASYIVEAMNGFCMQETTFPFVCTILDDASTDGEPEVIMQYLQNHFDLNDNDIARKEETDDYIMTFAQHNTNKNCYFAIYLLKYNHYGTSKNKARYITQWNTKYIAICEGDDYWIKPNKLQKQVDVLEAHSDYSMVCNRTLLFSESQKKYIGENYCYNKDRVVDAKDVIRRTGLFISTCSILYHQRIIENIPDYWRQCKVGDYPLQIACAMKGNIYYLNEIMSVYRVNNPSSWMGQQRWGKVDQDRLDVIISQVKMLDGFSNDNPSYKDVFQAKIADQINRNIPSWRVPKDQVRSYLDCFSAWTGLFTIRWKLDLFIRRMRVPFVRKYYTNAFLKKYSQRRLLYN